MRLLPSGAASRAQQSVVIWSEDRRDVKDGCNSHGLSLPVAGFKRTEQLRPIAMNRQTAKTQMAAIAVSSDIHCRSRSPIKKSGHASID